MVLGQQGFVLWRGSLGGADDAQSGVSAIADRGKVKLFGQFASPFFVTLISTNFNKNYYVYPDTQTGGFHFEKSSRIRWKVSVSVS